MTKINTAKNTLTCFKQFYSAVLLLCSYLCRSRTDSHQ